MDRRANRCAATAAGCEKLCRRSTSARWPLQPRKRLPTRAGLMTPPMPRPLLRRFRGSMCGRGSRHYAPADKAPLKAGEPVFIRLLDGRFEFIGETDARAELPDLPQRYEVI